MVTCLATDACLNADPGVASLILARSHTFEEIDHEIFFTVVLLPSAELSGTVVDLKRKRELVALLLLSDGCLTTVCVL